MAFRPVMKRSVPGDVFEQIAGEVLNGELAPGTALPSERQLAEALGVSRPAVREALQRLAAAGLVAVRQGGATTVLDYRHGAGLEVLPRLLVRDGTVDPEVARSVLEARLHNGPKVAELAADRMVATSPDSFAASITPLVETIAVEQDPIAQQRAVLEFWDRIVDAADSIVFRLMYNMLRAAFEPALAALAPLLHAIDSAHTAAYGELAAAVVAGRPGEAAETARSLLEPATTALITALSGSNHPEYRTYSQEATR